MSKSPGSCRRATYLISVSMDRPLSRRERLALRVHLLLCPACRLYRKQVHRLRAFIAELPGGGLPVSYLKTQLSSAARDRMVLALREEAGRGAR